MKKTIIVATLAAATAAYSLPTYEPFTEYTSQVTANNTNAIDLCTSGLAGASSGETWTSQSFSALVTNGVTGVHGLDVVVTNFAGNTIFTSNNLSTLLPNTFPGFPGSGQIISIMAFNPAQPAGLNTEVGNSAVLNFASDFTRPASGTKTLFISYIFDTPGKGQTGTGNVGRYLAFLSSSNLVQPSVAYPYWKSLYNTFNANGVAYTRYIAHGVFNGAPEYVGPTDSSAGLATPAPGTPSPEDFTVSYNAPNFIVGEFVFVSTNASLAGTKDTNIMWVNPSLSSFGVPTPPTSPVFIFPMTTVMNDVGGMVLIDRVGSGTSGGDSNTYVANLMLGTTWSYVTGGPEFTNQPASILTNYGSTVTLSAAATAAIQTVTYQWQKVTAMSTINLTSGAGNAGGSATVTIATNNNVTTLTLAGLSAADYGSFQVVATASGAGYALTSSTATITPDPLITSEPQNATAAVGGTAVFNIAATTQFGSVTYQWQLNGAALNNGAQGNNSVVTGATSPSLTIANIPVHEFPATITCAVSNGVPDGEISSTVTLSLSDPAITAEPLPVTVNYHGTATFTFSAQTSAAHSPLSYAWYLVNGNGSNMLANGLQADGSTVSGASGIGSGSTLTESLTLTNLSSLDDGTYNVVVSNSIGAALSSTGAALVVNDPVIITQPPSVVEVALGSGTTIPIVAAGSGVAYQWYLSGGPLSADVSGGTTPTLTVSGAQATDAGTYYVTVDGSGGNLQSTNAVVYVDTTIASASVTPPALTQQTNTHLALLGSYTGGSGGLVHLIWQLNGRTLSDGTQSDGSFVSGSSTTTLILSNLLASDSGTYTFIASNAANSSSSASVVTISTTPPRLSVTNLVVTRVGEGSQALSGVTGNTIYLDQFATNGAYVSTTMIPDSGIPAMIVPGGGSDGQNETYVTLSSNQGYLNFAGYCFSYPYTGPNNVTQSQQNAGGSTSDIRGIGAVNGLGYYVLAYTNYGLYSGGAGFIRDAYSTDGLTNFWTTGAAGGTAIKYVNAGPQGAGYAQGSGIPGLSDAVNGPISLGLAGSNLVFSCYNNSDTNGLLGQSGGPPYLAEGLNIFAGAPDNNPASGGATNLVFVGNTADFAFSPDLNTLYLADSSTQIAGGTGYGGGIQRWDWNGGSYVYQYNLEDTTSSLAANSTNGVRGLAVYFPPSITQWGQGVTGAELYATTSETVTNRIIEFTDSGVGSTATLLDTAGSNQFFRGIRFAPAILPVTFVSAPQSVNSYVGQTNTLTAVVGGDAPFTYQWQFDGTNITGATTSSLTLANLQSTNAGTYTIVVSDPASTNSASAVVTVSEGPPVLVSGPQSRVETVGDHLAFVAIVTGTQPMYYQWSTNGVALPGATSSVYAFTNIVTNNSGTYTLTYSNMFGTNTTSATLLVTAHLQALSSNNLIVARVGDGAQPLSDAAGNTLYLDQFTTSGVYSNTIMVPDNSVPEDLIVRGGPISGVYGSFLTLSATNGTSLNFCGYNTNYPNTQTVPFQSTSPYAAGDMNRSIGAVNAFGYYTLSQTNDTAFVASPYDFDCVVSLDGFNQYWGTGSATAQGLKYIIEAYAGPAGGNLGMGSASGSGCRVVNIVGGNVVYSDSVASPAGIWGFTGEPAGGGTSTSLIADTSGSPVDFAASPDTTSFPPSTSTVYLCDDSSIASGGGIQRYDWNGSAYAWAYTLGTGAGSTVGASALAVDFSASATWGAGVTGAIIYATTAGASSNELIKIVDTGAGSTATVLATATPNELLRGVRFGPVQGPPVIITQPQSATSAAGSTVVFSVVAENGPITGYQWQLNGVNLTDGPSPTGSGATISGSLTANLTVANIGGQDNTSNYDVLVYNAYSTPATSSVVTLTVPITIVTYPPAVEYVVTGGTAVFTVVSSDPAAITSYQWTSTCGSLSDGPSPCPNSTATISGSATASLTIADVSTNDDGSYYVTLNFQGGSVSTSGQQSVLTVINQPLFARPGITGLGGGALTLNFSGTAGSTYRVWGSGNVALKPITTTWTLITNGTFDGLSDSVTISATNKSQYYVITQP